MLGVGFSFGGCMLTAIAGSVPQEEHGLCGLVSISGLFDMAAMMRHIAEQYAYPYGFANTRVSGGGGGSMMGGLLGAGGAGGLCLARFVCRPRLFACVEVYSFAGIVSLRKSFSPPSGYTV